MVSSLVEPLAVLVVDDDDKMLRTIADILRIRGYAPVPAQTGRRGLELAGDMEIAPAVAIIDLRLPDMDGIELISRLHDISALTEVVILTGNASVDSAVRALREQSYDYLVKPVAPEQLLDSIGRAGERWQRRRAEAALHDSETRFQNVFDHVTDALFVTDEDDLIMDVNVAASEVSGLEPDDLRERHLYELLELNPHALGATATEPSKRAGEFRLRRADGSERSLDVWTAAFAPGLFVHTVRDITVQRRLEEELHHSQKMDAVGRLAGGVAHDFNNMLTAIICYAEILLLRADVDGEQRAEIGEIMKAARRAATLTGQLLAFSRKQILQPKVLDVDPAVTDVENMLRRLIGEDVVFESRHDARDWCVRCDPGQFEQVILNLAVNARDAMPAGGTLSIATTRVALITPKVHRHGAVPAGEYVVLEVRDTGTGIPDDVMSHIFEPFFTTKDVGRGTGLGLSTVYGIVNQTGGHIQVESELGLGTMFLVYFPRAAGGPGGLAGVAPRSRSAPRPATVLLVEDEPTLGELITRILTNHGHRVRLAKDARDALDIVVAGTERFDLVLTDIVMPGMGGRALAEQLHSEQPDLPVLFMTGYSDATDTTIGDHDEVLRKPFTSEELLRKVSEMI